MTEKERKSKGHTEAEEVREILEAVQSTVPTLISQLVQSIYSPKMAEMIAESVGTLYQNLKKKGLPEDMVLEMTRAYMKVLDIGSLVSEGISSGKRGSKGGDLEVEIERAIKEKLKERETE